MNLNSEIVGFVAGTLTTLCWTPQAIKILRSHDAQSISLITQVAFVIGCSFWLLYGVLIGSASIIVFNTVTVALNLLIIVLKLRCDADEKDRFHQNPISDPVD
ncbi:SemiSWEET family sugar transporter [Rhodoblastus sp.]|uniref:SemiSWEET family sugar transporter n=1 Tax=Rhodoblastus sp. TaxID=1962975 RepID=UPI003F957BD9